MNFMKCRNELAGRHLAVVETAGRLHRAGAVASSGQELRRVLLHPPLVAAGIEQDQVRQALRIAERILQGDIAAERMAEHRPLLEAQRLAQRVGIRGQVLPGHGRVIGAPASARCSDGRRRSG